MVAIVSDSDIRSGDPRIEGTRITVLDSKRRVVDNGEDPHVVAGEYDVAVADLFRALTYYYDHREALETIECEVDASRREGEQRTRDLVDKMERGDVETTEQAIDATCVSSPIPTSPRSTSRRFGAMATGSATVVMSISWELRLRTTKSSDMPLSCLHRQRQLCLHEPLERVSRASTD